MEEWCRENENECETEKVHCEEKYVEMRSNDEREEFTRAKLKRENSLSEIKYGIVEYSSGETKTEVR